MPNATPRPNPGKPSQQRDFSPAISR